MIPPLSAAILLREYKTGGGTRGNVKAGQISQALTGVPGLDAVFNPLAAEGGSEMEEAEKIMDRGPLSLRHRNRAMTAADLEVLAREASSEIAFTGSPWRMCRSLPGGSSPMLFSTIEGLWRTLVH